MFAIGYCSVLFARCPLCRGILARDALVAHGAGGAYV